jgi:hypothetical protein
MIISVDNYIFNDFNRLERVSGSDNGYYDALVDKVVNIR